MPTEVEIQRRFYAETAGVYNRSHIAEGDVHNFSLAFLLGAMEHFGFESVLDLGSGTGRAVLYVRKHQPEVRVVGVEPVRELREIGYESGLLPHELIDGDATDLQFEDGAFDVVCALGILHHIRDSRRAVSEMLRVSRRAVFISDGNNFGQGPRSARLLKQLINALGLWKAADFVKTKGKGYTILESDGLTYSYSVFSSYRQIRKQCKSVHVLNTSDGGINPYRSAPTVALLGVKA